MFLKKDAIGRSRRRVFPAGLPEVTPGAEVFTSDGSALGTIAEVGAISFKVGAGHAPDYWLGRDYVIATTPERVSMSFTHRELPAYRLGQPGESPEKDTTQESLTDTSVPAAQQEEQRLRMEQELAEQRRELPHTHPGGDEHAPPETVGGTVGEPVEEELRSAGIDPMADRAHREAIPRWRPPSYDEWEPADGDRSPGPARSRGTISRGAAGAAVFVAGVALLWLLRGRRRHASGRDGANAPRDASEGRAA